MRNEQALIPFNFNQDDQETLLRLADFDLQYGSEAFWVLFLTAYDKANEGWIEKDVLLELIGTLSEQADGIETGPSI